MGCELSSKLWTVKHAVYTLAFYLGRNGGGCSYSSHEEGNGAQNQTNFNFSVLQLNVCVLDED